MAKLLPLIIGGASTYILAKDSFDFVTNERARLTNLESGEIGADLYMNQLSATSQSSTVNSLQNKVKNMYLQETNFTRLLNVKNSVKAGFNYLGNNLTQSILTTTALVGGLSRKHFVNKVGVLASGLLVLQGVLSMGTNLLGFGKNKSL